MNSPLIFINSVVAQFSNSTCNNNERNKEDKMIIPSQLFEILKKILFLQVPFCKANEKRSKSFLLNFTVSLTKNLNWLLDGRHETQNLFFHLKVKIYILHAKFIKGFVLVNQSNNDPSGRSELSEHLHHNINHVFTWSVIWSAPKSDRTWKNLEAFDVALLRPNLNEQCSIVLTLFRSGIT